MVTSIFSISRWHHHAKSVCITINTAYITRRTTDENSVKLGCTSLYDRNDNLKKIDDLYVRYHIQEAFFQSKYVLSNHVSYVLAESETKLLALN